jgi:hypothetical protein
VAAKLPAATAWGERKPSYWLVDARGNGAAVAVNRLVAAGVTPSWIGAPIDTNGFRYEAGSIVVPYAKKHEAVVARIASELGLRVDGMKGKAPSTARAIGRARVALYKPWTETIDEGWTRWLLERHEFSFSTITDRDVRAGGLRARFDLVIVPSAAPDRQQFGDARKERVIERQGQCHAASSRGSDQRMGGCGAVRIALNSSRKVASDCARCCTGRPKSSTWPAPLGTSAMAARPASSRSPSSQPLSKRSRAASRATVVQGEGGAVAPPSLRGADDVGSKAALKANIAAVCSGMPKASGWEGSRSRRTIDPGTKIRSLSFATSRTGSPNASIANSVA